MYKCNLCSYSSEDKSNLNKHNRSKKHIEKVNLLNLQNKNLSKFIPNYPELSKSQPIFECEYCKNKYKHQSGLSKHKKVGCINKNKEFEMKVKHEMVLKERDQLKELIIALRQTITNTTKRSSSATKTLFSDLSDNPSLEELDYEDFYEMIKPKSNLAKEILASFRHNTLHEVLGRFILNKVKKKNIKEQSIFVTDTSRQTYYIKKNVAENISEWLIDKKGILTNELIIKPLIKEVILTVHNFNKKLKPTVGNGLGEVQENIKDFLKDKEDLEKLIQFTDEKKLEDKINKFICPKLTINFDLVKTLKPNKKDIPTLTYNDNSKKRKI